MVFYSQQALKVHRYRRNPNTTWYIIYDIDRDNNIYTYEQCVDEYDSYKRHTGIYERY